MIFTSVFFSPQASFRAFRISYYWAAKSSNHSKTICEYNQRVPWASPKRLKPHFKRNYWAPTSTSKSVFSSPVRLGSRRKDLDVSEQLQNFPGTLERARTRHLRNNIVAGSRLCSDQSSSKDWNVHFREFQEDPAVKSPRTQDSRPP